jgi:hypothetical protein
MKTALRLAVLVALALPGVCKAATPSVGVEQQIRRGFFAETDLGTYFDFRTAAPFTASNAQAYLQLGVGYDLTDRLTLAIQFGLGASSGVCLADVATDGTCGLVDGSGRIQKLPDANGVARDQVLPDNFSNTFFQGELSYRVPLTERLSFTPGVIGGYQKLDPPPLYANGDPTQPLSGGPMFGADLSLDYATHLDHFTVGIAFTPRYLIGPNLLSMSIFPRVKYTF